jgi:predicted glycoside hydrolase/deacetylase ChbG (UPF0249 family)
MIRLIVNADDLGLHPRIDEGIFRAQAEGIVTSASLLVAGTTAAQAVKRAAQTSLPLGVHLCLTSHLSASAEPSKVRWLAPGGRFRKDWRELATAWLSGLIPGDEITLELEAQIARAKQLGAKIDHLDVHQHVHLLPRMAHLVEAVAADAGLPLRWPSELPRPTWIRRPRAWLKTTVLGALAVARPERGARRVRAVGVFDSGGLTEKRLLKIISRLGDGDWELMCHPGLAPSTIPEAPDWRNAWESDLAAVCSPRVREALRKAGVELLSYGALAALS